ncbi:hypothetical protein [Pseudomonas sp. LRF_L74]|uniref:hypothetical protein n=1 Tax=Pseudomonas sp. LRF_L74 TaxID=3369422 RepID=UPI003F5E2C65
MPRLPDKILDACLCNPKKPLAIDPAEDFGIKRDDARDALEELKVWINVQQRMLWANRKDSLLLILQGTDCAGKDGVIRKVVSACDPQGISLHAFVKPNEEERRHDFLWRYEQALPGPGLLGVFNRSQHEAMVTDVIDGLCSADDMPRRHKQVQDFENGWRKQGIHPLKCYLHLSRPEQKRRLLSRLENLEKRWKLHINDLSAYRDYDGRQQRWAEQLGASHSEAAPWYILPADNKWLRDWLVASLLARELERLELGWPDIESPFKAEDLE